MKSIYLIRVSLEMMAKGLQIQFVNLIAILAIRCKVLQLRKAIGALDERLFKLRKDFEILETKYIYTEKSIIKDREKKIEGDDK